MKVEIKCFQKHKEYSICTIINCEPNSVVMDDVSIACLCDEDNHVFSLCDCDSCDVTIFKGEKNER